MEKLVSVIIPVYNVQNYVSECIESTLNQTYRNIEIILVDDGSTDKSGEICDEYEKKDSRIRVIHKSNGGLSDARNAGLDVCQGEFIVFVDSDDYIAPLYIEKMMNEIGESDMCICNLQYVNDDGSLYDTECQPGFSGKMVMEKDGFWDSYYMGFAVTCVVAWNKLYRSSIFTDLRYDKGKRNEDEFIIDKVVSICRKITVIPDKLYMYRQRPASIMNQGYSVKNLDVAEAVLLRADRLTQQGCSVVFLNRIVYHVQRLLTEAYSKLEMKVPENKKRYYDLKNGFIKLYESQKQELSFKTRIKARLYITNESLWVKIIKLKNHS